MERRGQHSHLTGDKHPGLRWTLPRMIEVVRRIKENGEPINSRYLRENYGALANAINNYPGSWTKVVTEAGFDPASEAKGNFGPRHQFKYEPSKSPS